MPSEVVTHGKQLFPGWPSTGRHRQSRQPVPLSTKGVYLKNKNKNKANKTGLFRNKVFLVTLFGRLYQGYILMICFFVRENSKRKTVCWRKWKVHYLPLAWWREPMEEVASWVSEKLIKIIPHEIVDRPGLSHEDHRQCFLDVVWTVQRSSPKKLSNSLSRDVRFWHL